MRKLLRWRREETDTSVDKGFMLPIARSPGRGS